MAVGMRIVAQTSTPELPPLSPRRCTNMRSSRVRAPLWKQSGFADEASLGWPLRPLGGTFISINRYRGQRSATCIFRTLLRAATSQQPDRQRTACLHKAGSCETEPSACLRCWWRAIMRLPKAVIRASITSNGCASIAAEPELKHLAHFTFGVTSRNPPPQVSDMAGWLAIAMNDTSFWQGFHNWHQDGPHDLGRNHKAFIMVAKNGSTAKGGEASAMRTNLVAVPAAARYAHNCAISDADNWGHAQSQSQLGCTTSLRPGDVLFFREDIWHRSQDAELDRIALIVDVIRLPLRSTPLHTAGEMAARPGFSGVDAFASELHAGVKQESKGQWGCSIRTDQTDRSEGGGVSCG